MSGFIHFSKLLIPVSLLLWYQLKPAVSQGVSRLEPEVPRQEPIVRPTLRTGSQGSTVSELQAALKLWGYYNESVDGNYGESTAIAVSQFQRSAGLKPDGIVGRSTWEKLFPIAAAPSPLSPPTASTNSPQLPTNLPLPEQPAINSTQASASDLPGENFPVLKEGMRGAAVFWLQRRLQTAGFFKGSVDGIFGSETEEAVKAAQRRYRLNPDGIVGPTTWRALLP